MNAPISSPGPADPQAIADHYQQAAQALLLAYQRNKAATRHHSDGALRAALHHAQQSCAHVAQAQQHMDQALRLSQQLSSQRADHPPSVAIPQRGRSH